MMIFNPYRVLLLELASGEERGECGDMWVEVAEPGQLLFTSFELLRMWRP